MNNRDKSEKPGRNRRLEQVPPWLNALLVGGAFSLLVLTELRRPLRRSVEGKIRRDTRNGAIAALGGMAMQLAEVPLTRILSAAVERRQWGALKIRRWPLWLEVIAANLLLDYTLYLWHVLTHRVPFLWRFHKVHHADLDMDASTALRFHFGELIFSVPWRAAQILTIGVCPLALSIWQMLLMLEIMFHHSNLKLPIAWERRLGLLIVTPRIHGIHHSTEPDETDANWSSGLTVWDWLHRTLRLDVPQQEITIGVDELRESKDVTLPQLVTMPFKPGAARRRWGKRPRPRRARLAE